LLDLANSGMNIARLNMSHGSYEEKSTQIGYIREISKEIGKPLAVMADLQGPKMRLGIIDGLRHIVKDETVQLSINPTDQEIPIQFDLSPFVKKGQRVYLNDGLIELKVLEVKGKVVVAKAVNSGVVSSNKGVNIPDTNIKEAAFTDKDYRDCEFALKEDADFIALSFVQTAEDLKIARELIKQHNSKARIVVKIEKMEAIKNLESIIAATDAVMVARGDLAIETPAPEVPIIQQKIIKLARQSHIPVIVATQMLESMTENPRPTRAETSDVANAVLDQVDAVMLSAESASGKYPVEATKAMDEIIHSVEEHLDYKRYIKIDWESVPKGEISSRAITSSAASLAYRIGAKIIVVATATGRSARFLSSFRPDTLLVAVTHDDKTSNQLSMVWGVRTLIVKPTKRFGDFLEQILQDLQKKGFAHKGDKIVVVTGSSVGTSGGTDTIKVTTL
jgi:pyruvate kinase